MLNSCFAFREDKQHMRGARGGYNRVHLVVPHLCTVIDVFRPVFNTLSQDIIVSEPFSDGFFGVFSWSVDEVLRKNREAILVDIIVEGSQRNLYIHSFIDENLSGGIDG